MRSTTAADGGDQAGGREYVEGMAIADDEYVTGGEAVDAPLPQPLWGTDPPNHRCGCVWAPTTAKLTASSSDRARTPGKRCQAIRG
jgi:hypothetical protein